MGKPLPPGVEIRPATDEVAVDAARGLFRTYKAEMRQDLCFQAYEAEVNGLPGEYAPPGGALLLAWNDGRPVACVAVHEVRSERPGRKVCEMKRLYALPEARGLGLGRALAERIIEEARRIGYDAMRLDTLPMMREAIALYASMGFREIHAYRHNPVEGVLFLELDLREGGAPGAPGAFAIEAQDPAGALREGELSALRTLAAACGAALAQRLGARGEVRVRVVRDEEMARIHLERMGVEGATDVLTFDMSEANGAVDADVLVCADVARREAAARGPGDAMSAVRELALYIVHGALHCLGFDDHFEADAARMHAMEDAILEAAGAGRVFGGPSEGPRPACGGCDAPETGQAAESRRGPRG